MARRTDNDSYPHYADFSLVTPAATSLAPGQSTTFTLTFLPSAAGNRQAMFSIASNDPDENPFYLLLSGNGTSPAAAMTPAHAYEFNNGSYMDTYGGTPMASGGGSMGTGKYTFPAGSGPYVSSVLANAGEYTLEILMRFSDVAGYRTVVNFDNNASDRSLLVLDGKLSLYSLSAATASPLVFSNR